MSDGQRNLRRGFIVADGGGNSRYGQLFSFDAPLFAPCVDLNQSAVVLEEVYLRDRFCGSL